MVRLPSCSNIAVSVWLILPILASGRREPKPFKPFAVSPESAYSIRTVASTSPASSAKVPSRTRRLAAAMYRRSTSPVFLHPYIGQRSVEEIGGVLARYHFADWLDPAALSPELLEKFGASLNQAGNVFDPRKVGAMVIWQDEKDFHHKERA